MVTARSFIITVAAAPRLRMSATAQSTLPGSSELPSGWKYPCALRVRSYYVVKLRPIRQQI